MVSALKILCTVFGYNAFRGDQAAIIDHMVDGGDALVLMPTGGGKSLCYQIPALLRPGVGIIISPLIALMQDQVDALLQMRVRAAYLNSSLACDEAANIERRTARGELDLLYVAPERLLTDRFLNLLDQLDEQRQLALFAIDEAHCVSQWGHDFRPEYIQLSALHERYPRVPRIALTATADPATREEIQIWLGLTKARLFISSFDRPNIRYEIVSRDNPRKQLLAFLSRHRGEAGIVYCLSRKKVEETVAWLETQGIAALTYHAGLDAEVRRAHQQQFLREEGLVMVATVAFGMGIDKPGVRFVAHLDLPKSLEAYYQETGRAGRDGELAEAWMTYGLNDVVVHRSRIDESNASQLQKRIKRQKLDALLAYCEAPRCRRTVLLSYFGEQSEPCGNCDVCLNPPEVFDGTIAAQKALSAILRTGQRFGAGHLVDLLRGRSTNKIRQFGHESLPTFGVGSEMDDQGWRAVFRQLIAHSIIEPDSRQYGALTLKAAARRVLKGETSVLLRRQRRSTVGKKSYVAGHASSHSIELDMADQQVFEKLRAWRQDMAQTQAVPAYVILHDCTLVELSQRRPHHRDELMDIIGLGEAKIERYGEALVKLLNA